MYTIDDERNDTYEDDNYEVSSWDNNKGLIFKIIIIILCIIVLIWLVKALKNNSKVDNGEVHIANVEKVRLASEKYFFINNNKDNSSIVSLKELKNNGLIGDITDANNNTCDADNTKVTLKSDVDAYTMTVKLSCSTNDNEEKFYYHNNTLACLNCNGKTNMDGKVVIVDDEPKKEEEITDNSDNSNDKENDYYNGYSCINWSDWSSNRVFDSSLVERTKTLVQGVKHGSKTIYTEWSEYSTTPVVSSENIEVETKTETVSEWSETKTGTNIDTNSLDIRIISYENVNKNGNNCAGNIEGNTCYSNQLETGNLTMKQYASGDYKVINNRCEGVKTLQNSDGQYVLTYVNCKYYKKVASTNNYVNSIDSSTIFTYQERITKEVVYYRYRYVNTINEPDEYTNVKYEEKDLPEGYVKVDGSEETYYSYKLNSCEK